MFSMRRERRYQVERLEDEAEPVTAQLRELLVVERGEVDVADEHLALGQVVEPGEGVHQRRLAGARRAHDGGEAAGVELDVDGVEGADDAVALAVGLGGRHGTSGDGTSRRPGGGGVVVDVQGGHGCTIEGGPDAGLMAGGQVRISGSGDGPPMTTTNGTVLPLPSKHHATCAWCGAHHDDIVELLAHVETPTPTPRDVGVSADPRRARRSPRRTGSSPSTTAMWTSRALRGAVDRDVGGHRHGVVDDGRLPVAGVVEGLRSRLAHDDEGAGRVGRRRTAPGTRASPYRSSARDAGRE